MGSTEPVETQRIIGGFYKYVTQKGKVKEGAPTPINTGTLLTTDEKTEVLNFLFSGATSLPTCLQWRVGTGGAKFLPL